MPGRYLPDTNIVIAFLNGESAVQERMRSAEEVFGSSIVLGELYFGARKSGRMEANLARIDAFVAATTVLQVDADAARMYGIVKSQLQRKGRPIPENDIWIAAVARQWDLTVATRDGDFDHVDDLKVERW